MGHIGVILHTVPCRTVDGSDAAHCSSMLPLLPPVGWGVAWAILGVGFMASSCYLALVILD